MAMETKEEFSRCAEAIYGPDWQSEYVVLPCTCGEDECHGWAFIDNDPREIERHKSEEEDRAVGGGE